ncbi:MAG: hypothetical protein U0325_21005 [Polyangiales bacterium]
MQARVGRARREQRVERAHHDLGDAIGHRELEDPVPGRGVEGHRDVDESRRGVDDLPRGATQLLRQGRAGERAPHAHQQRIVELRAQATERVARRRGGDREAPRRAGDVRLLQKGVQGADVVQVEGRELHVVKDRPSRNQLPPAQGALRLRERLEETAAARVRAEAFTR